MFIKNLNLSMNKSLIVILLLLIIFLSSNLRLYKLADTFSEYDDIFMISLHKNITEDRKIVFELGGIQKKFIFKADTLKNLEKSYLFPFYIAYTSTYSPAQYVVLPFLFSEKDTYKSKIYKTRIVSSIASILSLLLILFIFFKIDKRIKWEAIFVGSLFGFSINSILYAHHGGVYSMYCLTSVVGLFLIYLVSFNKISFYSVFLVNTILLYFSYMNFLFFLPFIYLIYKKNNIKEFMFSYLTNKKNYLFLNILIALPIIILFLLKDEHEYSRGKDVLDINNFIDIFSFIYNLVIQFYISIKSVMSGFIPHKSGWYFFIFFNLNLILLIYYVFNSKNFKKKIILVSCFIYLFQWIILYCLKIIPLDQTRHSLVFFPVLLIIIYIVLSEIRIPNLFYILLILLILPFVYINEKKIIDTKVSLFDFEFLSNQDEKYILSYDSLPALIYFQDSNKKVFYTALKNFRENYLSLGIPNQFLLVGHHHSFFNNKNEHISVKNFKKNFPELIQNYKIETLVEKPTQENLLYNSYDIENNNPPNGFFVYRFIKRNK